MSKTLYISCPDCEAEQEGSRRETMWWWAVHCTTHQWWYRLGKGLANAARRLKQVVA